MIVSSCKPREVETEKFPEAHGPAAHHTKQRTTRETVSLNKVEDKESYAQDRLLISTSDFTRVIFRFKESLCM